MFSWIIFYITVLNWEFLLNWYNFFWSFCWNIDFLLRTTISVDFNSQISFPFFKESESEILERPESYILPPTTQPCWGCVVLREICFLLKKIADWFNFLAFVEKSKLNTDMYKFESSQSEKSRTKYAGLSQAYSKPRAFYWWIRRGQRPGRWTFASALETTAAFCCRRPIISVMWSGRQWQQWKASQC